MNNLIKSYLLILVFILHSSINSMAMDLLPGDKERVVAYLLKGKRMEAVEFLHQSLGMPMAEAMAVTGKLALQIPSRSLSGSPPKRNIGLPQTLGGVLFLLIGVAGLAVIGNYVWGDYQFTKQASRISATVIEIIESESVDDEGHRSTGYFPIFKYTYKGREYTHQSSINFGSDNYKVGENVNVFVNPESPDRILVDTFTDRWGAYILFSLFAIFAVALGCMLLFVV